MPDCRDLDLLVTPFVDGEADLASRSAVAAHLEDCGVCRARVEAERAARTALRSRAAALVGRAPIDLRARCAAALRPPVARPSVVRTVAGLSMAAMVVVAIAGVATYGLLGRTSVVLAAQLTIDHLKCFSLYEGSAGPADPARLEARLLETYGWHLIVPPSSPDGHLRLVGARRCITADGRIAHILYRYDGRPVSLFMLPSTERPEGRIGLFGYESRIWSRGGATYVMISGEQDAQAGRVAAYLQGMMH